MAAKEKTSEVKAEETTSNEEDIAEIKKAYEEMKSQIAVLTKQAASNQANLDSKAKKLEEEKKLLELVNKANADSEELVEIHVDVGSIRSNKNLEVSINGVQTTMPKGETVQVKKSVKEIVDNAKMQKSIALGLQEQKNTEYKVAEAKGAFRS